MKYLSLTLLCLFCTCALAKPYPSINVSKIISVYDGDTFRVDIANYPALIGENISIRVNGVDTPEIRAKCSSEKSLALKAKQFTQQRLNNATNIELINVERGKYFRLIADVIIDGENLASLLIKQNLGKPYQGGKRVSWCS